MSETTNVSEYSVSEISQAVKRTVEDVYGYVRVRGEISGFRGQHGSGHAYFAMKDDRARLEAVIWRGVYNKLKVKPEEGLEVIATGKITTYPGSSKYQIVIERLEPAGVGALMALLAERKKKLEAEGLFDPARKQLLPYLPKIIGVITSPTGAVIRDIVHRLEDRFPSRVLLWPVRVQGESSGEEVTIAVQGFNALDGKDKLPRPDVIIVARGGGSLEDLWGFNDEALVRAVAASDIPVISAIGHETDWTLIDYAADVRAPTPTGAAEMVVPVRYDLIVTTDDLHKRLRGTLLRHLTNLGSTLRNLSRALPAKEQLLALPRQRFDDASGRLPRALGNNVRHYQSRFDQAKARHSFHILTQRVEGLKQRLHFFSEKLSDGLIRPIQHGKNNLASFAGRLSLRLLETNIKQADQKIANLEERLNQILIHTLKGKGERLEHFSRMANLVSYQAVLGRGFALVRETDGSPVRTASRTRDGTSYYVQFYDGPVKMTRSDNASPNNRKIEAKKPIKPQKTASDQGNLF